jgi:hypothetical protein
MKSRPPTSCRLEHHVEQGIGGVWDTLVVEQVVENLLSNAIKFGQGEPVTVRLRSESRMAVLRTVPRRGKQNINPRPVFCPCYVIARQPRRRGRRSWHPARYPRTSRATRRASGRLSSGSRQVALTKAVGPDLAVNRTDGGGTFPLERMRELPCRRAPTFCAAGPSYSPVRGDCKSRRSVHRACRRRNRTETSK